MRSFPGLADLHGISAVVLGALLSYATWRWGARPASSRANVGSGLPALLRGLRFSLWSVVLSVWTLGGGLSAELLGISRGSLGSFDQQAFNVFSFWLVTSLVLVPIGFMRSLDAKLPVSARRADARRDAAQTSPALVPEEPLPIERADAPEPFGPEQPATPPPDRSAPQRPGEDPRARSRGLPAVAYRNAHGPHPLVVALQAHWQFVVIVIALGLNLYQLSQLRVTVQSMGWDVYGIESRVRDLEPAVRNLRPDPGVRALELESIRDELRALRIALSAR